MSEQVGNIYAGPKTSALQLGGDRASSRPTNRADALALGRTKPSITMLGLVTSSLALLASSHPLHLQHHAPAPLCRAGISSPTMIEGITKRERLVRQRLNPRADLDVMTEEQLRKYAYAMQIEVQRLIREEQSAQRLRSGLAKLLKDEAHEEDEGDGGLTQDEFAALIPAMKMEGLVRYGLAYATVNTNWDKVRKNHPEFASRSDKELFEAFQATGKGISSTFGDLW